MRLQRPDQPRSSGSFRGGCRTGPSSPPAAAGAPLLQPGEAPAQHAVQQQGAAGGGHAAAGVGSSSEAQAGSSREEWLGPLAFSPAGSEQPEAGPPEELYETWMVLEVSSG